MTGTLIVALDLDSRAEAERLIADIGDAVDFYKIGYQLFYGGDGLDLGKAQPHQGYPAPGLRSRAASQDV